MTARMENKMSSMGALARALTRLGMSDDYPFHMPGHKRNPDFMSLPPVNAIDITEIDGFDDLHHPSGILKDAQARAAKVRGAERTWFLINGSTAGILSAVSACSKRGGRIIVARNCHKAVYNAIELCGLRPVYVYPGLHPDYGIYDGVAAEDVRALLEKYDDILAVVITSPTYEGVISDIRSLAGVVHSFGIPLIVDGAHGAHLGYGGGFAPSAVAEGADLVIESLHKTLPSMTQTALLHRCGNLVDDGRVQKYLSIFQSSSPSYVMMAAIDQCMTLLERQARPLFEDYESRLNRLRSRLGGLRRIKLLDGKDLCRTKGSSYDPSKLVLYVTQRPGLGRWLYDHLRKDYRLQLEMASADYALAMTSICDTDEGFERLALALEALDTRLEAKNIADTASAGSTCAKKSGDDMAQEHEGTAPQGGHETRAALWTDMPGDVKDKETPKLCSSDAAMYPVEWIPLGEACGRICGSYLYIYPPGVPFCVPGEPITSRTLAVIERYMRAGLEVAGLRQPEPVQASASDQRETVRALGSGQSEAVQAFDSGRPEAVQAPGSDRWEAMQASGLEQPQIAVLKV